MMFKKTLFIEKTGFVAMRMLMVKVGLLYILISLGCAQNISVQNNTNGLLPTWKKEAGLVSSGKYRTVAIADLDNDGNPDVVGGASSPGIVAIWYGNGPAGLSEPKFIPLKGDVQSIAVADFNEDGLKDIVLSVQRESSGIMVLMNKPNRKWGKGTGPIEVNNYHGVETADINRDGHIDIIAANTTSDTQGGIQVWLGDGRGNWPVESGPTITGIYMDVALADFDKDGVLDLAGAGWGTYGFLRVWLGDGTGDWSSTLPLNKGSYYALTAGDLDGDGNIDILAGTYRNGVQIFLGDGKGSFARASSPEKLGSFWKILPTDLDGDGTRDLLASSIDSKGIKAWKNQGPSAFSSKGTNVWSSMEMRFPSTGTYYEMAIGDLNKDGRDDICAASFGEGIKMWLGEGGFPVPYRTKKIKPIVSENNRITSDKIRENAVFTTISGFPEYKIGPGDVLEITLWKGTAGTKEIIFVRPDGKISFGYVQDIYIKGMTPTQLDDLLTKKLSEYIKHPRIDVFVKEYKSKFATFMGALGLHAGKTGSGKHELTGKSTLLEMLSKAGGPSQDANLRDVRIRRKNGQAFSVDLYKAINQGDQSQDIVLDDGDLVFIPSITKESNRVYVFGEVNKPGVYTFSGSTMRLFDAVSQAGGPTVFGIPASTKIVRGDITRPEVIPANLKALIEEGDQTQNVVLANGDLVYIPRSFIGDVNLFVKRIRPLMQLFLFPDQFRDGYDSWREP